MKSDYVCLNSETFEIQEDNKFIAVDSRLARAISTLNKKGYYVDMFSVAKISNPFKISDVIHNLIEEKVLDINNHNDKIKKAIKYAASESTMIVFKDSYKFNELPDGYKIHDNRIVYYLTILNDTETISFKSLVELDHELDKSLKDLEEWAESLPKIKSTDEIEHNH